MEARYKDKNAPQVITTTTIVKDYDPHTGNKMLNNYMILKEIGRGVHGKVKLAQHMGTGELAAIKIVDKKNRRRQMGYSLLRESQNQGTEPASKENEQKIRREIAILEKCCHPNVVRLREVIDVAESRKIYMALEYTESGEIEWRDSQDQPVMSVEEARRIFRNIVNGLDYLHFQGIIHRDIKPANLLLSHDGVAKISDFGVSYYNPYLASTFSDMALHPSEEELNRIDRELAETAGTPAFFAPELCCAGDQSKAAKKPRISKAIDVWALGVTLYCFIFGQCPFIAATEFELFDTIPSQPLIFPTRDQVGFEIDGDLQDLLKKLLTKNPDDRITLDQVKRHPWVIADLNDYEKWIATTEPHHYFATIHQQYAVNDLYMNENMTMMERLRQSIRKLSFSFAGSGRNHNTSRRRLSKQQQHQEPPILRPVSYQPSPSTPPPTSSSPNLHKQPPTNSLVHRFSQPLMSKQPSYSTSLLPHATSSVTPTVSLSTGHTLIFNSAISRSTISPPPPTAATAAAVAPLPLRPISTGYLSDDSCSLPENYNGLLDEDDGCTHARASTSSSKRPNLSRRVSSASSSSGLGLTFGRYRGGMTPMEITNK
ncbi:kinase-like domain-containing protein [Parasitella parasitica]|nr:kinase-like domain-containing protein [Parasitella parasitica]